VTIVVALVLFPAVTRLAQIGVPQNPASFSGVHRSGVMPVSPQLALPENVGYHHRPEAATHPAESVEVRPTAAVSATLDTSGLRAPPPGPSPASTDSVLLDPSIPPSCYPR
jgi:hypothetical protein